MGPPLVFEAALSESLLHLDLNLLVALDALLSEKSVTRAAARVHRSQPSLSGSLKRLRLHFHDDLLVRVGNNLELTPLGAELHERLPAVMSGVAGIFAVGSDFDPGSSNREFVIIASDYVTCVLGPTLTCEVSRVAPNIRMRFETLPTSTGDELDDPLRACDGLIAPQGLVEGWPNTALFHDSWVLLIDPANSRRDEFAAGRVTVDDLSEMHWVLPFHREDFSAVASRQLRSVGVDLRSVVSVDGFSLSPAFVRGSDRITVMQQRLVRSLNLSDEFLTYEFPQAPLPVVQALFWHPIAEEDPGHRWFRQMCRRAGSELAVG